MSQFIHGESEIPSSFDELESGDDAGLIMRTAVDFELISEDGSLVAIEHLGKGTTAILVGYIIEPIQNDIKHSMIDLLCTSSQDLPSDAELAMLLPIAQKRRRGSVPNKENVIGTDSIPNNENEIGTISTNLIEPPALLDHSKLKIGDCIDGYCNKTFRWYEAKVVDSKKTDQNDTLLRIHFSGWNSKYDEWISQSSERIASRGSSSSIVLAAAKSASTLVPWWKTNILFSRTLDLLGQNGKNITSSMSFYCFICVRICIVFLLLHLFLLFLFLLFLNAIIPIYLILLIQYSTTF